MTENRVFMLLFLLGFVTSCAGGAVPKTTRLGIKRTNIRATHHATPCRDGAVEHGGKCYKLFTDAKTFEDAKATCRAAPGGGHLIAIDSAEVQEFVKSQMEGGNVDELWIGASKQTSDWRWVETDSNMEYQGCFGDKDDARLDVYIGSSADYTPDSCIAACHSSNMTYAGVKRDSNDGTKVVCRCGNNHIPDKYLANTGCNFVCPTDSDRKCGNIDVMRIYSVKSVGVNGWLKNQPNNFQTDQACVAMHRGDHYKWGDEQCNGGMELYGHVCQYNSDEPSCSHKYDAGKCYSAHVASSTHVSWYKARYLCQTNGGDLLQVDTKDFFDFLKAGSAQLDANVQRWWIGGTRERWQWVDGQDIIFTNWAADRPNSGSKACAIVGRDVGHSYEWEDKRCSDVAAFICLQLELTTTTAITTAQPTSAASSTTTTEQTTSASKPDVATSAKSGVDITSAPTTTTMDAASKTTTKATTTAKSTTTPATTTTKPTTTTTTTTTTTITTTTKPTTTTTKPTMKSTTAKKATITLPAKDVTESESTTQAMSPSTPAAAKATTNQTFFTTGVVIGIVVAVVIVLLVFLRIIVYCVTESDDSSSKKPFDVNNQLKSETFDSFDDPDFYSTMDTSERVSNIDNPIYDVTK